MRLAGRVRVHIHSACICVWQHTRIYSQDCLHVELVVIVPPVRAPPHKPPLAGRAQKLVCEVGLTADEPAIVATHADSCGVGDA